MNTETAENGMVAPKVTFLVPCYKLAHFLGNCLRSILAQSYKNFEILVLDDCSPDNTPEVAQSFDDHRVRHIRNEPNLGHLRNYNQGISLARGEYVWLISADDCLRTPYVLERYLHVMESRPEVGFAFCPGFGLLGASETGILSWAVLDQPDGILKGRQFLRRLLESNCVLAPSGLVRAECYQKLGAFPLDLPFAGDWYLWCIFALHYDVAYFSEPMVNYREHSQSMTDILLAENARLLCKDDLAVRWRMKEQIEHVGDQALAAYCVDTIVEYYTQSLTSQRWRGVRYRMSLEDFDESLSAHALNLQERDSIRTRILTGIGGRLHLDAELHQDPRVYKLALHYSPSNLKLRLKYFAVLSGTPGLMAFGVVSKIGGSLRRLLAQA